MPVPLPAADLWVFLRAELLLPGLSGKRCEEKEGTLPHFPGPEPDETSLSLIHRLQCIPQLCPLNNMICLCGQVLHTRLVIPAVGIILSHLHKWAQ